VAQAVPGKGLGDKITVDGKYYYSNIGQKFTSDSFFYSRPSAVDYNASGSGASNKSPYDSTYLTQVQARIDTFIVHNPGVQVSDIPCDMITASGSGLDPNISVQAAQIQVPRIAKKRGIPEPILQQLILTYIEKPWMGLFGTEKINVVKLNVALSQIH
jgi:K+-transporting ATPase ATPase C chain